MDRESLEYNRHAAFVGEVFEQFIDALLTQRELVFKQPGFERADAAQTPAGDGHGVDQLELDGVGGVVAVDVGIEETLEVFLRFAGHDGETGGEPVAQGVEGRRGFTGGGFGSTGFGAVGSGGLRFTLR